MGMTEQQKQIAMRVCREFDPSVDERVVGGILEFASRFLAALPKPEDMGLVVTTVPVVFEETEQDKAYDMIDRQLRNSLDDAEYAEYSAALDIVLANQVDHKAQQDEFNESAVAKLTSRCAALLDALDQVSASRNIGSAHIIARSAIASAQGAA